LGKMIVEKTILRGSCTKESAWGRKTTRKKKRKKQAQQVRSPGKETSNPIIGDTQQPRGGGDDGVENSSYIRQSTQGVKGRSGGWGSPQQRTRNGAMRAHPTEGRGERKGGGI